MESYEMEMVGNTNFAFDFSFVIIPIIYLIFFIFIIYFLVSVLKFMKKKIKLDEQRVEQTNRFLEIYKNTNDRK